MGYDQILISDLEIMARANNYRWWMYQRLAPFIGQRVIEIGAGIGNFTNLLLDREFVLATDNYLPCVEYLNTHLGGRLKTPALLFDVSADAGLELRQYEFDSVVCLNVLEHIENDLKALTRMHGLLAPGGRLVLLVPAFQFLYGTVDRALGHYRRYTRKSLLPLMRQADFGIEQSFYMNVVGMAGWFWNNRIVKRSQESKQQIGFFDRGIAPAAEFFERMLPPPLGLSLIAIGRKN